MSSIAGSKVPKISESPELSPLCQAIPGDPRISQVHQPGPRGLLKLDVGHTFQRQLIMQLVHAARHPLHRDLWGESFSGISLNNGSYQVLGECF